MTTKLWYTFKRPNAKATVKQIELVLKLYKRRYWSLNNAEFMKRKLAWMTVLQVSNLIEKLLG